MYGRYEYGLWSVAIFNILIFTFFTFSFLKPKRKVEWRSLGIFEAFIIALYAEMYGFPLTIFIFTSVFGDVIPTPFSHMSGHLLASLVLGEQYAMLVCTVGNVLMLSGLVIMGIAWCQIHRAKGELVTNGLYRYIRHPQYLGLIMITVGMLIQWPTIITLVMWPVLMVAYYLLARREDKELEKRFGEVYLRYKQRIPIFIP